MCRKVPKEIGGGISPTCQQLCNKQMEDGIGELGARRERSESYPVGRRKADPVAKLQFPLPLTTSLKPQRTSTPPPDSKMVLSEATYLDAVRCYQRRWVMIIDDN